MRFLKTALLALGLSMAMIPPSLSAEKPLKVVLVSGAKIYETGVSLPKFKDYLETHYPVDCTLIHTDNKEELPGLEALEDCDTALFFTRRMKIDGEDLEKVKEYLSGGHPIVALRTASHGFQNYLEFDKEVLGGNYDGHFKEGIPMEIRVTREGKDHPALQGVGRIETVSSLYRTAPIAEDATLLMEATTADSTQPLVWTREHNGGRVLYAGLGTVEDFEQESFKRLVANALFWTAGKEIPEPK
ncbi:MAG: ThuA domain-containing protein [Candidatus Omnitrophica bacterium]|nr:ThuA domain-containing protein [Candidatus Omnitrophota bacterium]